MSSCTETATLSLHLGCGKRHIPGFVHVDLEPFPHVDYRHSIDRLPMFADDTVGLIYACHVFEYFDRVEARDVLAEWQRVLRPGGILRLAVPDFAALLAVYQETGQLDRVLGPLFGRIEIDHPGCPTIYHRTTYDFASLRELLENCGFRNVHRYDWRDTSHAQIDDFSQAYYPHMDKENGRLVSLNVECAAP